MTRVPTYSTFTVLFFPLASPAVKAADRKGIFLICITNVAYQDTYECDLSMLYYNADTDLQGRSVGSVRRFRTKPTRDNIGLVRNLRTKLTALC